ncbi:hypothetical protein ACFLU6_00015 [Acidobacteriota bacterium]
MFRKKKALTVGRIGIAGAAFAALLLTASLAFGQNQVCIGSSIPDPNLCAVDSGPCDCDFRSSTKTIVCDDARDPDGCTCPPNGAACSPGDYVIVRITVCNDGTQDPRRNPQCAHGDDPMASNPWGFKDPTDEYHFKQIIPISRNGADPDWSPVSPDLWTFYMPGPVDGCNLPLSTDLPVDDIAVQCITNLPSTGNPSLWLENQACFYVEFGAQIDPNHPLQGSVCNQATILDPLDRLPPIPVMGCTTISNDTDTGTGDETCLPIRIQGTMDITKSVDKAMFSPGEVLRYTLCLKNYMNVSANSVNINDYLVDDCTDGISWIDKTNGCIQNFSWDNAAFDLQVVETGCLTADDDPIIQIYEASAGSFDMGPYGEDTDHVCIEFDVTTSTDIPVDTGVCNPILQLGCGTSTVAWNLADPEVLGDQVKEQACSLSATGAEINASKSRDIDLALPGSTVTFTFSACNLGNLSAVNWVLQDTFDEACFDTSTGVVTPVSDDLGGNVDYDWTAPDLTVSAINNEPFEGGDCVNFTFAIDVAGSPTDPCCNTGYMTWEGQIDPVPTVDPSPIPDAPTVNDSCVNTRAEVPTAVLTATKDVTDIAGTPDPIPPRPADRGDLVNFQIVLTENLGDADATEVVITDVFPDTCFDVSGPPTVTVSIPGAVVTWTDNQLDISNISVAAGQSTTIDITGVQVLFTALGECCNQADITYWQVPDDSSSETSIKTDDPDRAVLPEDPTCIDVQEPEGAFIQATKDVSRIDTTMDPPLPRNIRPGQDLDFQIVLSEMFGAFDARAVSYTDVFSGTCFVVDPPPNVIVNDPGAVITWTGNQLDITGMIVPKNGSVIIDILAVPVLSTASPQFCCNHGSGIYFLNPTSPDTGRYDTDDPDTIDTEDATCVRVVSEGTRNLRREGANQNDCPLAGRPVSPSVEDLFVPELLLVADVSLPYVDADYRVAPPDGPLDNSCLLFYQHDDVARIAVTPVTGEPDDLEISDYQ